MAFIKSVTVGGGGFDVHLPLVVTVAPPALAKVTIAKRPVRLLGPQGSNSKQWRQAVERAAKAAFERVGAQL
eukprot:12341701-Alexandrium_andersonii.AAC.1